MSEITENIHDKKHVVISVEKTKPPAGLQGDNWYQYIIGYEKSRMVGIKPGTLKSVTAHAIEVTNDLNSRSSNGFSTYAPRQKKK